MNRRVILHTVGQIIKIEAALLILPLLVSLYYQDYKGVLAFAVTAGIAAIIGFALTLTNRRGDRRIFARGGLVSVALSWIALSLIGALPFVISGQIPSYVDALFETVSGFSTTGASVLFAEQLEHLTRGMLFWRSFTHWIGGMGVIVLMMAILPSDSGRAIHIMRAEMPGPVVGKLVPRLRDTAKTLYIIYIVMTALQILFLVCGDMPLYDSVVHAFGTAGTGGFGIKPDSIGGYSAYSQWVIAIFMLLFGVNFNVYQLLWMRRFRSSWRSSEMWCYFGIVGVAVVIVTVCILPKFAFGDAVRHAVFQVASVATTTGYSTTDFNLWPGLAKVVLVLLMFIGACAGSTAGGLKVSRVMILCKSVRRDLRRIMHPRSVSAIKLEGKRVDDTTLTGVGAYFILYVLCLVAVIAVLSFESVPEGFNYFETHFTAAVACFNNIGPGLDGVGPASHYGDYSAVSKLVLSLAMLLGRLEIYPLLVMLSPSTWSKKH